MQTTLTPIILEQVANRKTEPVNARRNGKIARLPKEIRDILNRMLDDGLPYRVIIDELGEAGEGLNAQNITNWVQGGYQDYLKNQHAIARVCMSCRHPTVFVRTKGDSWRDSQPALFHCKLGDASGIMRGAPLPATRDEPLGQDLPQPIRPLT